MYKEMGPEYYIVFFKFSLTTVRQDWFQNLGRKISELSESEGE